MKLSEKIVKNHTQSDRLYKKRDDYSINNFIQKINLSRKLNTEIENKTKDNKLKVQSRENLIINSVTALEVFIKDSIKGNLYYFSPEKQKDLLKEKITLWEAYELFRNTEIETEDIIAGYYNFQNLDSISYVLGTLTGKDFFKSLNNIKTKLSPDLVDFFKIENLNLEIDFPNWQKDIRKLLEIRHESIHEIDFTRRLGKQKTNDLIKNLIAFTIILSEFFGQTIDDFLESIKRK